MSIHSEVIVMYGTELKDFIKLPTSVIQKNEFIYFSLPKNSINSNKNLIRESLKILNEKTSRLYVNLEEANDFENFIAQNLENLPTMIGIKLFLGDYKQFSRGSGISGNDSNLELIQKFENLVQFTPKNISLIPELDFTDNEIQVGPTIYSLFQKFNLPFLFISISGPPEAEKVKKLRNIFDYLKLRGLKNKIYFTFSNEYRSEWEIKTFNTFSGMQLVHIDLSNKCTHSCVFCGVWGPEFIEKTKKESGGKMSSASLEFMNRQLPIEVANRVLSELPETVTGVQFGGVGDPLTHSNWLEIIQNFRHKGIQVEILTNLDCENQNDLKNLHLLSNPAKSIQLLVNLSAGNRKTYSIIRPRQSEQVFDKIFKNIEFLNELKNSDGYGVSFTFIHVINKLNYLEMEEMVLLGKKFNARVWLKPLEIHSETHNHYAITPNEKIAFKNSLQAAVDLAKKINVDLIHDDQYFKGFEND